MPCQGDSDATVEETERNGRVKKMLKEDDGFFSLSLTRDLKNTCSLKMLLTQELLNLSNLGFFFDFSGGADVGTSLRNV